MIDCGGSARPASRGAGQESRYAAHHAALPRRSCRQPAAHRAAERGAREARERRDLRRSAQSGRRPRDRKDHQAAGRHRAQGRHRRRIPPRLLELRFSRRAATASKPISASARSSSRAPNPKPMMLRVIGKLGAFTAHPMLEHFKFVKAHTRALPKMTIPSPSSLHFRYGRDAVPARTLSRHERFLPRSRRRPTARRCAPSPMPAAATCSSTRSISPISAIPSCARRWPTAATIRKSCRRSTPA